MPDQLPPARPRPVVDEESAPYWQSIRERTLRIQRCRACGHAYHYPRVLCPACGSEDVGWVVAAGTGTIYSYTVSRRASAPAFEPLIPLVVALIELDEGPRMLSNVIGAAPSEMAIGARVTIDYLDLDEEITLPVFRLSLTNGEAADGVAER